MPTFKSFADFGDALDKMAKDIERESKTRIASEMAKRAQAIAETQASADLGGDPKFSGWKPPLGTHIKPIKTGMLVLPTRSGAGPWTVANQGRNQGNASGFSGPGISKKSGLTKKLKSGGVGKVKAFKSKRWNGTTKGKHTADKAVARMERELYPIAEIQIRKIEQRHFDVT